MQRYIIEGKLLIKDTLEEREVVTYIEAFDIFPCLRYKDLLAKKYTTFDTFIFYDREDAEDTIKLLQESHKKCKYFNEMIYDAKTNKEVNVKLKFYLVKVDSLNMPYKILSEEGIYKQKRARAKLTLKK